MYKKLLKNLIILLIGIFFVSCTMDEGTFTVIESSGDVNGTTMYMYHIETAPKKYEKFTKNSNNNVYYQVRGSGWGNVFTISNKAKVEEYLNLRKFDIFVSPYDNNEYIALRRIGYPW